MNKINDFLNYFLKQKEAGLIILDNLEAIDEVGSKLQENGLIPASSWQEIIENFRNNRSVYLTLDENISKEIYDLISQYNARSGAIQIMDKDVMKLESVQFDPFSCHLLVVVNKDYLDKIEKNYSIKDKVGLVERI